MVGCLHVLWISRVEYYAVPDRIDWAMCVV